MRTLSPFPDWLRYVVALAPVVTFGAAEVVPHAAATVARSAKPRFGITILEGREREWSHFWVGI